MRADADAGSLVGVWLSGFGLVGLMGWPGRRRREEDWMTGKGGQPAQAYVRMCVCASVDMDCVGTGGSG